MPKLLTVFLLVCMIKVSQAVEKPTLSGFVSDSETGEMLIGATIFDSQSGKGTITNGYGYFSLNLPVKANIQLIISYIGYQSHQETLMLQENVIMKFTLSPSLELDPVIVTDTRTDLPEARIEMGTIDVPLKQLQAMPSLGGEKDILKALQLMPGVKFGDEGKSGLYVRGGSPDENLVLLDDVPLYSVNHLGGYVSIFNTDAINSIKMYKGSFPANYGGRLASVLDIRMKDGNMKETKGSVALGLLTSKVTFEGPVKKDTSSYLISVRRFMYDIFMKPLTRALTDVAFGYTFYDINAKYNTKLTSKDRLYLSFYTGDDNLTYRIRNKKDADFTMRSRNTWGNLSGALRWNHIYTTRLFGNLTYSYTQYRYLLGYENTQTLGDKSHESSFRSGINDHGIKYDWEYYPGSKFKVKVGIGSTFHVFSPGQKHQEFRENQQTVFDTTFNGLNYQAWEHSVYLLSVLQLSPHLGLNTGVRCSYYTADATQYQSAEPRAVLNYQVQTGLAFRCSYSYVKQYLHLLSSSGLGMPTDIWMLSTAQLPPQEAWQTSLGVVKRFRENRYELSSEIYYTQSAGLIDYQEGASLLSGSPYWQDKIETAGEGNSYGLEMMLLKKEGATTGWAGATVSHTTREFENINSGKPYPYTYDRLVDIGISIHHQFNQRISLSGTWVFNTGNAFTLPVGYHAAISNPGSWSDHPFQSDNETLVEIYEGKNTFRAKPYHRMDIGVDFTKNKPRGTRIISISIYNVYNHLNPFYYYSSTLYTLDGKPYQKVIKQVSYFPIIPSISYQFNF